MIYHFFVLSKIENPCEKLNPRWIEGVIVRYIILWNSQFDNAYMNYQDLSLSHQLISDMFPKLEAAEAWEQFSLSEDQVQFFNEHGYLSHVPMLESEQIETLKNELNVLMSGQHPAHDLFYEFHSNESEEEGRVLFHSLGHWRLTNGFHDVLWNPKFVVPACQLLGVRAVRFWHDQLFCKPAHHGGVVAWHQDFSYWTRTSTMQHLTCWVGLDQSNVENGCLNYIPGSHRWDLLDRTSLAGEMDGIQSMLNKEQRRQFENKVAIEMEAGFGVFHHPLMVHGSFENKSDRPRRAFVINVFADGTISETNQPLLNGVPVFEKGKKLEGQFFPILFDPTILNN